MNRFAAGVQEKKKKQYQKNWKKARYAEEKGKKRDPAYIAIARQKSLHTAGCWNPLRLS